jgi:hypothetical protein
VVVVTAIGKTWWDSRINLIAGLIFLIGLTLLYFLLRSNSFNNHAETETHPSQ